MQISPVWSGQNLVNCMVEAVLEHEGMNEEQEKCE